MQRNGKGLYMLLRIQEAWIQKERVHPQVQLEISVRLKIGASPFGVAYRLNVHRNSAKLDRSNDGQDHTVSPYAGVPASSRGFFAKGLCRASSAVRTTRLARRSRGSAQSIAPPCVPHPRRRCMRPRQPDPRFATTYDRPFPVRNSVNRIFWRAVVGRGLGCFARRAAQDLVARMELSVIRGSASAVMAFPDCASLHPGYGTTAPYPAFAFSPAAWMPATAQASSLSEVSPETPTAPSSVVPSMISTPPGTGTSAPLAMVFTASMK